MGDFNPVVRVSPRVMNDEGHDSSVRRGIAPEFVRNDSSRLAPLTYQDSTEKTRCCLPIAARLDQDVEHVTVLINGTPEVVQPTLDFHGNLIEVPGITQTTLSSLEGAGVPRTELETPLPNAS